MRKLFFIVVLFSSTKQYAQQIRSSIINSCGSYINSSASVKIIASIGEPVVGKLINSNIILCQGFLNNAEKNPGFIATGSIILYPNPAKGILFISGNAGGATDMRFINVLGQQTAVKKILNNSIDLQNMPSGFYVVMIFNSNGGLLQKSKIVKQ